MYEKLRIPLKISEVEFRIQKQLGQTNKYLFMAYKDARVDQNRLDKVIGTGYWQRKHEVIDGKLYCSVGIYNPEIKEWVWVQDVGNKSNFESDKGAASDSFKRACFNLGIGRELYEYPTIVIELKDDEDPRFVRFRWEGLTDEKGVVELRAYDNQQIRYSYTREEGFKLEEIMEDQTQSILEHIRLIEDMKEAIERYSREENLEELYQVAERWYDIPVRDQHLLNRAPSKGGPFTTAERKVIKEKFVPALNQESY
jgi:hypothetical protein